MDKEKKIWEDNLELAQILDDIIANKNLYSHDSLCSVLEEIKIFLRRTGHELEKYDRNIQKYKDILFKLP